jgi:hypothetical protein
MADNEGRLRKAGMVVAKDLPPAYEKVVEGLTDEELDVLEKVKKRLDEAERESRKGIGEVFLAP